MSIDIKGSRVTADVVGSKCEAYETQVYLHCFQLGVNAELICTSSRWIDPFFRCTAGDAGHHEGHLRHDGKMHVPNPQRRHATSACRGVLSGK